MAAELYIGGHRMPSELDLAVLCKESYETHCISEYGVEANIRLLDGNQIVAIRGTQGILDLARDAMFGAWYLSGMIGHAGMLMGAYSILDNLKDHLNKKHPIVLTGHSLGGGIAIPLCKLLRDDGYNVVMLVTFGCPKVLIYGHRHFKDMYVSQYELDDDAIPTLGWFLPRRHINRIPLGEGRSKEWLKDRNLDDHSIDRYIEALR